MGHEKPLDGIVVGLAESRELDLLASMFADKGASSFRCPLVAIKDAPDAAPIEAWLRRLIAGEMDDLICLTGEGVRRLTGFAERAGLKEDFVSALKKVRKVTRGPKPTRALRELGLSGDLAAAEPTTEGIILTLQKESLAGRTVGVQLYGQVLNERLTDFLTSQGARVDTVAPYIYADDEETARVVELIDALASRRLDVMVFTSASQVDRLWNVAKSAEREADLTAGLAETTVAAVGPVVAEVLKERGISIQVMPEEAFFMRPLLNAIIRHLRPTE